MSDVIRSPLELPLGSSAIHSNRSQLISRWIELLREDFAAIWAVSPELSDALPGQDVSVPINSGLCHVFAAMIVSVAHDVDVELQIYGDNRHTWIYDPVEHQHYDSRIICGTQNVSDIQPLCMGAEYCNHIKPAHLLMSNLYGYYPAFTIQLNRVLSLFAKVHPNSQLVKAGLNATVY